MGSQYKGRYLVVVFYRADWKCAEVVEEFSNIKSQLASNGADVVCVSSDSTETHTAWIKADKGKGGLGGSLGIPLWSDPTGELAISFDLYHQEEKHCLDGFVIIDDAGLTRQVMTTSLESKEVATSVFSMVPLFKRHKVDMKDLQAATMAIPTSSSSSKDSAFKVSIDVKDLEKGWDVTEDPELRRVLNVAKLLGRTAPPKMNNVKKLTIPRTTVKSVMASLQRNLSGFSVGGDVPANH